jgi:hypothetical protein
MKVKPPKIKPKGWEAMQSWLPLQIYNIGNMEEHI